MHRFLFVLLTFAGLVSCSQAPSAPPEDLQTTTEQPVAAIDLATRTGLDLVDGEWRYRDAEIVRVDFTGPGLDGQPTGEPVKTYDIHPHAGTVDFDDSDWEIIEPESLDQRRGAGRMCFNWYRVVVTIPELVDGFDATGMTVVFETSVDDYAEVWVDGELPRAFAQSGGSMVKGWNAPNQLVIGRNVKPGQKIQLAVFGMNAPISNAPTNFIWMRTARLDFFAGSDVPVAVTPQEVNVDVVRLEPGMDAIVPPNPKIFKLAEGFEFIEGPVWREERLLFSDPNANRIYQYTEDGELSLFRERSGYDGSDIDIYFQPGSNGLAWDPEGRLTICEHGNRRVSRLEEDGSLTVVVDRYQGKRLNSPNDLVYAADGTLYFTDPPFGLPQVYEDPNKELDFSGVFRWTTGGELELIERDLKGPNGLALSPDGKFLYVDNWDTENKIVMRYTLAEDGAVTERRVFFDMTASPGEIALDGLKLDTNGNVYVSGPGGIWVLSAEGEHLGTIKAPRLAANFAWGGQDGKTLYLTARSTLYRMPLLVRGVRP